MVFDRTLLEFPPVLPFSSGSEAEVTLSNPMPYPVEIYSLNFDQQYIDEEEVCVCIFVCVCFCVCAYVCVCVHVYVCTPMKTRCAIVYMCPELQLIQVCVMERHFLPCSLILVFNSTGVDIASHFCDSFSDRLCKQYGYEQCYEGLCNHC